MILKEKFEKSSGLAKTKSLQLLRESKIIDEYGAENNSVINDIEYYATYFDFIITAYKNDEVTFSDISSECKKIIEVFNSLNRKIIAVYEYEKIIAYTEYLLGVCFKYYNPETYEEEYKDDIIEEALKEEFSKEPNWCSFMTRTDVYGEVDISNIKSAVILEQLKNCRFPRSFLVGLINVELIKKGTLRFTE